MPSSASPTPPTNITPSVVTSAAQNVSNVPTIQSTVSQPKAFGQPSNIANTSNIEYNNPKGVITDGENNVQGVGQSGRINSATVFVENDKRTLEKIRPNRAKTDEYAVELEKKKVLVIVSDYFLI